MSSTKRKVELTGELWYSLSNEGQKMNCHVSIHKGEKVVRIRSAGAKRKVVFEKRYTSLNMLSTFSHMQQAPVKVPGQAKWYYLVLNVKPEGRFPSEVIILSTNKQIEYKKWEAFLRSEGEEIAKRPPPQTMTIPPTDLKVQIAALQAERNLLKSQLRGSDLETPAALQIACEEEAARNVLHSAYTDTMSSLCMVLAGIFSRELYDHKKNITYSASALTGYQRKLEDYSHSIKGFSPSPSRSPQLACSSPRQPHSPMSPKTDDVLKRDNLLEAAENLLRNESRQRSTKWLVTDTVSVKSIVNGAVLKVLHRGDVIDVIRREQGKACVFVTVEGVLAEDTIIKKGGITRISTDTVLQMETTQHVLQEGCKINILLGFSVSVDLEGWVDVTGVMEPVLGDGWIVASKEGVAVRASSSPTAYAMSTLQFGTVVQVSEATGGSVRIVSPIIGWASVEEGGRLMLERACARRQGDLETQLQTAQARIRELEGLNASLAAKADLMSGTLDAKEEQLQNINKEYGKLKKDLDTCRTETGHARGHATEQSRMVEELHEKLVVRIEEVATVKSEMESLQDQHQKTCIEVEHSKRLALQEQEQALSDRDAAVTESERLRAEVTEMTEKLIETEELLIEAAAQHVTVEEEHSHQLAVKQLIEEEQSTMLRIMKDEAYVTRHMLLDTMLAMGQFSVRGRNEARALQKEIEDAVTTYREAQQLQDGKLAESYCVRDSMNERITELETEARALCASFEGCIDEHKAAKERDVHEKELLHLTIDEMAQRRALHGNESEDRIALYLEHQEAVERDLADTRLELQDAAENAEEAGNRLLLSKQSEYGVNKQIRELQRECAELKSDLFNERDQHVTGQQDMRRLVASKEDKYKEAVATIKELETRVMNMQIKDASQQAQMAQLKKTARMHSRLHEELVCAFGQGDALEKVKHLKATLGERETREKQLLQEMAKFEVEKSVSMALREQLSAVESQKQKIAKQLTRQVTELEGKCRAKDDEIMKLEEWSMQQACQQAMDMENRWKDPLHVNKITELSKRAEIAEKSEWLLHRENSIMKQQLQKYELKCKAMRSVSSHVARTTFEDTPKSTTTCRYGSHSQHSSTAAREAVL